MNRGNRSKRNTQIVALRLAGDPIDDIARQSGASPRTIRDVMLRWRRGELKLNLELRLHLVAALAALEGRLSDPVALGDFIRLSSELTAGWSAVRRIYIPPPESAEEINLDIRAVLEAHGIAEELIDEVTQLVVDWQERASEGRWSPGPGPWA
jgi:hypothetical protein